MSGIKFLLDTNVVIGLLKGYSPATEIAEQAGLTLSETGVNQITRMELLGYPKLNDQEEAQIRTFLAACQVCLIDEAVEAEAIRLRRTSLFKLPDAIVAATAMTRRLKLLTLDQTMLGRLQRLGHEF